MAIPFLNGIDVTGTVDLSNLTIDGAQGTDGQVLTSTESGIAWEDASGGASLSGGEASKIAVWSATDTLTHHDNFHFDTTNVRLGIGTDSPAEKLVVSEARSGTTAADQTKYTLVSKSTISSGTPGTGGIKVVYDDGTNEHGFGLVSGSSSADFLTTGPMHFYTNSDLNTNSATGYAMQLNNSGQLIIAGTNPITGSAKLSVAGETAISGNLGVGVTGSTGEKIDVSGTNAVIRLRNSSSTAGTASGIVFGQAMSSEVASLTVDTSTDLKYIKGSRSSGTTQFIVKSSGNVGIGTSSPSSKLEIVDDLSGASTVEYPLTLSVKDDNNSIDQQGGEGVGIKFKIAGNDATDPGNSFVGAGIAAVREAGTDTYSHTGLAFYVSQNNETLDEVVKIDQDGYVGINETNPNHPLHITKPLGGNDASSSQLKIEWNGTYNLAISHRGNFFGTANNDYTFYRGSTAQMIIKGFSGQSNYGYVGIGEINPSEKLHVNGSILATSFKKSGGTSSQFLKADGSVDSSTYLTSFDITTQTDGKYLRSNTGDTVSSYTNQIRFPSATAIDTTSGNQASLEVFQSSSGDDAFMAFHVSGDYAAYFGLDGASNDFVVGGWSKGAVKQRVFHDGYHPNADKWTTARTITLGGDLSGSVSIDGSANVTLSGQVTNDSHDHTRITERSTITYGASQLQWTDLSGTGGAGTNGNAPGNPFSDWHHHIIMNHGNSNGYYVDTAFSFHSDRVHFRRLEGGTMGSWREFFHTGHVPTYSELGAMPYSNLTGTPSSLPANGGNADTVDDYHANRFFRRIAKANATVGGGWMTVAENVSGRRAGEIVVTDADSGDHAYIRIEWMRSYGDSNFTVLNCGGHANRITGVRVLYNTSDNTYGGKKLQVYVTTSSNYEVNIYEQGDIDDYSTHSVVTPVIQNTISGYALHGKELTNLDTFGFAAEEGILSGGDLKVLGTGNGIHVDSTGHASLRLDRGSTSYDNNLLFMTGGGIKWRLWQDGTDNQLMIRDDANSYNSVVFNAGGASGYTTFNNPIRIGGTGSANELDDYEEGTYNIRFYHNGTNYTFNSSNFGTIANNSKYVKVGRMVTIYLRVEFDQHPSAWANSSSNIYMNNLPFTPVAGTIQGGCAFDWLWATDVPLVGSSNSYARPNDYGAEELRQNHENTNGLVSFHKATISYGYYTGWSLGSMSANDFPSGNPGGENFLTGSFTYYTND